MVQPTGSYVTVGLSPYDGQCMRLAETSRLQEIKVSPNFMHYKQTSLWAKDLDLSVFT